MQCGCQVHCKYVPVITQAIQSSSKHRKVSCWGFWAYHTDTTNCLSKSYLNFFLVNRCLILYIWQLCLRFKIYKRGWLKIGPNHGNLFLFCQILTFSTWDKSGHMAQFWPMRIRERLQEASGKAVSFSDKRKSLLFLFSASWEQQLLDCGCHFVTMRLHDTEKPIYWQSRREAKSKHWLSH